MVTKKLVISRLNAILKLRVVESTTRTGEVALGSGSGLVIIQILACKYVI